MKLLRFAAVLVAIGLMASNSLAAIIPYGNFTGTNVSFLDVEESTTRVSNAGATDPGALFNAPTISGNNLDFNPTFSASAGGAGGTMLTDGQLNFMIDAAANTVINTFTFLERGDTTLFGAGTDATQTAVSLSVLLEIQEIDGVATSINLPAISGTFNPSAGDFKLVTDGAGTKLWNGGVNVNITGWLTANNISFVNGVTKLGVALDNTLTAASEAGTTAAIFKKDIDANTGVRIIINGGGDPEVPEPATVVLAGLAVVAGVVARRRLA